MSDGTTAQEVWNLLATPLHIDRVVLDTVIAAGRHSTGDLFHRIFDALANKDFRY